MQYMYIYKFIKKIREHFVESPLFASSFGSDVLKLVGSTAFAQALRVLASPVVTRLYSPEAFGLFALFGSITSIMTVIVCLRYELAIMLPKKYEESANLLGLSLLLAALMSLLMIPVIWMGQGLLLGLLNAPGLASYLWLVPPMMFLAGAFQALNYWNSRTRRFGRLSIARLNASLVITGTQIGAGLAGYATGGSLIGASILGSVVSTLVLGGQIWRDEINTLAKCFSRVIIIRMAKRYKDFPKKSTWSGLLNVVSWQLPALLLSAFFSIEVVGFYSLSFTMVSLPMSLIGGAISQVFFQRAAEARRNNMLSTLIENIFEVLVVVGMLPMLLITFIGRDIFILIFGPNWVEAGTYSQIMAIWALVWFISFPISVLIDVLEIQNFGLFFNISNFVARLIALCAGGLLFKDARLALILFSIAGVLVYGYICIGLMLRCGSNLSMIFLILSHYFIRSIPGIIIILVLKTMGAKPLICIVASLLFVLIYYIYLIKIDSRLSFLRSQLA